MTISRLMLVAIILLLFPFHVHALGYDIYNTISSRVQISNSFNITALSPNYNVEYVNVSLSSFPRSDARQQVVSIYTDPKAAIINSPDGNMTFLLERIPQGTYSINVYSGVTSGNYVYEITSPVNFPITYTDNSLYTYLQPGAIIDITPGIRSLASQLIGDKTDLYSIEFSFAEYVRQNIRYDLNSLSTSASERSSEVLVSKRGVCDELTSLFISLNRAAGIPARFVSGVAYTNLDSVFGTNWVPHAWAEVYFSGYGWVPFDVTYGEYGYLDSGHIKLGDSADATGLDVAYNYYGSSINLVPGSINTNVTVVSTGTEAHSSYEFDVSVYADKVGFGSYDLVEVGLKNPHPYYVVADVYLASTDGIAVIDPQAQVIFNTTEHRREVLLPPHSQSTAYYMIRVGSSFDSGYSYTLPILVYDMYNDTSMAQIEARQGYASISDGEIEGILSSQQAAGSLPYSGFIDLQCTPDRSEMHLEDSLMINCTFDNIGDKNFSNITICIDSNCSSRPLGIENFELSYLKRFDSVGIKSIEVKAYGIGFFKASYIAENVLDSPNISIPNLTYPYYVGYNDNFTIGFTLAQDSISEPKNLVVRLANSVSSVSWKIDSLSGRRAFTINSLGGSMAPGDNKYMLTLTYADDRGKIYTREESFNIVSTASPLEDILLYLNVFGHYISKIGIG